MTSTRLVSFTQRAIAAICYEVEAVDEPARIVVQSELVANERVPDPAGDPRVAAALDCAARSRGPRRRRRRGSCWSTAPRRSRLCGWRPAWTTSSTGPDGTRRGVGGDRDMGRVTVTTVLEPGQRLRIVKFVAYGWSGALGAGAARPGRGRPPGRPPHRLGRAGRRAAGVPRRLLGRAPTWRSTATPASSRPCASPCSTSCRPAPGPSSGRSRPRASPVPATTATRSGTPRSFVLPVLTYTVPAGGGRRPALAPRHPGPGPRAGRPSWGWTGRRSRGGPSPARSARPTGRPAPPRSTSTPTSPTPSIRYVDATGDEEFERDVGARAAGGDRPAVAVARPPRPPGQVPHRRGDRARRVQRRRRQQRLHQPHGRSRTCRGGGRRRRPPPRPGPARSGSTTRRPPPGATRPRPWWSPTTPTSGCIPQAEGFTDHQEWDFDVTPADALPAACCTIPTSTSTASRW